MSDRLIGAQFAADAVDACLDDAALLSAMLRTEAALAAACADAGLVPGPAADAIGACCRPELFDLADIGRRAAAHASPVVPLVDDLRAAVPKEVRPLVHYGATSQDIVDTATSMVLGDALDVIGADLAATAGTLATLAHRHAATMQIGRTLLQQAEPTTFGLVCAGWLTGLDDARAGLSRARGRLAAQVGGAVGTRARYGTHAAEVAASVARRLGLADPVLPWHADRQRPGELAAAAALAAGALATIARNVALLAQTEVAELSEGSPGGSSAMRHKRNPVLSVLVVAGAQQVVPLAAGVLAGLAGEGQRAAGSWQAELPALRRMLSLLGGAAAHTRRLLAELRVDTDRMRANLEARPSDQRTADSNPARIRAAAGTLVDRALAAHAASGGTPGPATAPEDG